MRLFIASLAILLLGLPPLLGVPPFYLASGSTYWSEFWRTALATLVGAGAAFAANLYLQDRARRRDHYAAGNFAMATLGQTYIDLRTLRTGVHEELRRCNTAAPGRPTWMIFRPVLFFQPSDFRFDFKPLTFLFEDTPSIEAFQALHRVQWEQRDLFGHVETLNSRLGKKNDRLEEAGHAREPESVVTVRDAALAAGGRLIIEIEQALENVIHGCENNESPILEASRLLYLAMKDRFPDSRPIRVEQPPE
ncbi:MAG TPA: hypothetical protein VH040_16435 [Usitatibacter sp.]|jgi:hypothetical protein|nr:hypothetical protein [Usitatibacter sp.]